jgi:uncharacterized protein YndB with AHSA1/START domain
MRRMPFALREEPIEFVDRAPIVVRAEVTVRATPERVWTAFADAAVWPQWFKGLKVARYTSPPPYGVGTKRHVELQGFKVDETILAFDVARRYAFRVDSGNLPLLAALVEVVTLEPQAGATRVVYRQAFEPSWWLRPVAGLFRRQMERGLREGLAGLEPWVLGSRS